MEQSWNSLRSVGKKQRLPSLSPHPCGAQSTSPLSPHTSSWPGSGHPGVCCLLVIFTSVPLPPTLGSRSPCLLSVPTASTWCRGALAEPLHTSQQPWPPGHDLLRGRVSHTKAAPREQRGARLAELHRAPRLAAVGSCSGEVRAVCESPEAPGGWLEDAITPREAQKACAGSRDPRSAASRVTNDVLKRDLLPPFFLGAASALRLKTPIFFVYSAPDNVRLKPGNSCENKDIERTHRILMRIFFPE